MGCEGTAGKCSGAGSCSIKRVIRYCFSIFKRMERVWEGKLQWADLKAWTHKRRCGSRRRNVPERRLRWWEYRWVARPPFWQSHTCKWMLTFWNWSTRILRMPYQIESKWCWDRIGGVFTPLLSWQIRPRL